MLTFASSESKRYVKKLLPLSGVAVLVFILFFQKCLDAVGYVLAEVVEEEAVVVQVVALWAE